MEQIHCSPGESIAPGCDIPSIKAPAAEIARFLAELLVEVRRIADALNPPPPDLVDSVCVSEKLGGTTTWVADMARNGEIPRSCIVTGTGNGKPWKFHRTRIDEWIARR
ncbi:MAG TPA: helix-turn-helix domain-containing protein [Isosphaeraceae bacterium]|nr:helix-turn-helix domain-containing protein [Isosphaeraceae bacterium]